MQYSDYKCFQFSFDSGVAFVSINHPPINLLDETLSLEFDKLGRDLEADDSVRVVVVQSALPDFFIAHSGLGRVGAAAKVVSHTRIFRLTQMIGERFRNMNKATIAKVEGRARGGGSEIALAMDMCFAAVGKAIFGQPEVGVGLVPGGGSTQRLPRLMGRARALEVLLGCNDFPAELAERYGYINRALPADELTPFVEKLAHRIASFPAHAIAHAKAAVDKGAFGSMAEGLLVEAHESDLSVASEVTQARVREALKVGAETYEGELEMDYFIQALPITNSRDWANAVISVLSFDSPSARGAGRLAGGTLMTDGVHDLSHLHRIARGNFLQGYGQLIGRDAGNVLEHRPQLLQHVGFVFIGVATA